MLTKQSEMQSQVILISSLNKGVLNSYSCYKKYRILLLHSAQSSITNRSMSFLNLTQLVAAWNRLRKDQESLFTQSTIRVTPSSAVTFGSHPILCLILVMSATNTFWSL